ncbi:MAG: biliverdin-producing heme oxygenase [Polyangiaceae bacterium]
MRLQNCLVENASEFSHFEYLRDASEIAILALAVDGESSESTIPLGLRATLRSATSARHAALDSALGQAFSDVEHYVAFLSASHAAVSGIEPELVRFGLATSTERLTRLEADLLSLGAPLTKRRSTSGMPDSVAAAYGAAYVLEGSSLGGLTLAKRVEGALGVSATRYLRLRGAETMHHFRRFVAELDAWGAQASQVERQLAIRGADAAFAAYEHWFAVDGLLTEST